MIDAAVSVVSCKLQKQLAHLCRQQMQETCSGMQTHPDALGFSSFSMGPGRGM